MLPRDTEAAPQNATHESPQTTKLYDRITDEVSLGEIERVAMKAVDFG